jgi:hypothetical protein
MESTDLLDIDQEDFPGMHAEMCLKDRERYEKELAQLSETNVALLQRIERLETAVREFGILL